MWEYQKRIHNRWLYWKVYLSFWIGWVIGLEAGGKEDKTGILASSNEYWMLLNEYWFSAPSFLLGQNCAIFSSVRVTACNTTGWQSTSKLKLGQLKGKFSNINITRSSKDEYSTGSNNYLLGQPIFLNHRSLSSIDQKILVTLPPPPPIPPFSIWVGHWRSSGWVMSPIHHFLYLYLSVFFLYFCLNINVAFK